MELMFKISRLLYGHPRPESVHVLMRILLRHKCELSSTTDQLQKVIQLCVSPDNHPTPVSKGDFSFFTAEKLPENNKIFTFSNESKFTMNVFSVMIYCNIVQLHNKINFNNFINGYSFLFIKLLKI